MNDSDYIKILCGEFSDSCTPLSRAAFWNLYRKYNNSVEDLINSGEEQIENLLKRSASVSFAIDDLRQMGFHITTFLDSDFPAKLLEKLNNGKEHFCPPLLYTCGNCNLNKERFVGYVGSRSITEDDIRWTEMCVGRNIQRGFGIVTGGAKGIDSTALTYALDHGSYAIVYLPDNIKEKSRESLFQRNLIKGSLLVYSQISPFAKKSKSSFVAAAMERNKYIYAQSDYTVVVHSDLEKGGTWAGAKEALQHSWTTIYTWDNKNYPGNQKLIKDKNARALSDDGHPVITQKRVNETAYRQMALF